jgi:hypothetical protein
MPTNWKSAILDALGSHLEVAVPQALHKLALNRQRDKNPVNLARNCQQDLQEHAELMHGTAADHRTVSKATIRSLQHGTHNC